MYMPNPNYFNTLGRKLLPALIFGCAGTFSLFGQFSNGNQPITINSIAGASFCGDSSVSANTITCATVQPFPGYVLGQSVDVRLANTVSGATTINVNGLGAVAVTYNGTNALTGAIGLVAGATARLTYDGTRFVMQGIVSSGGGTPGTPVNSVQFNSPLGTFAGNPNFLWTVANVLSIGTPDVQPTVVTTGGGNGIFMDYYIVCSFPDGSTTAGGSLYANVSDGPTTLDATHFNQISWTVPTGASSCLVYTDERDGTPNSVGLLGTVMPPTATFRDDGVAGDGTPLYPSNTTGSIGTGGSTTFYPSNFRLPPGLIFELAPNSNLLIGGSGSGAGLTSGQDNTVLGSVALLACPTCSNTVAVGRYAAASSTFADSAVIIGHAAGGNGLGASEAVLIGLDAGTGTTGQAGAANAVMIGYRAGSGITTGGSDSVFVGWRSGFVSTSGGNESVFIGYDSGIHVTTADDNVFVGYGADLASSTQRSAGIAIGHDATIDADGAVSIGAGVTNTVANSLNIGTNSTTYMKLLSATSWQFGDGTPINPVLSGTTGSIGGGLLSVACTSGTASVTGATTGMAIAATPVTYPGDGVFWHAYVSGSNTVTVKVCTDAAITPTASTYNLRVIQ